MDIHGGESYGDHLMVNDFSGLIAERRIANLIEVAKTVGPQAVCLAEGRERILERYRHFEGISAEIDRQDRSAEMRRALMVSREGLSEAEISAWIEERLPAVC